MIGRENNIKEILFYGDSNTYGYDPRGFGGGRYPEEVRWTELLRRTAGDWQIFDDGMNGREIPSGSFSPRYVAAELDHLAADWLAVMLGTNDLLNSGDPDAGRVAEKMERFLLGVERIAASRFRVLLIAPPPAEGGWADAKCSEESRKLSAAYCQIAAVHGWNFVNSAEWNCEVAFDGVHLSEEGHRSFAAGMLECLRRLI